MDTLITKLFKYDKRITKFSWFVEFGDLFKFYNLESTLSEEAYIVHCNLTNWSIEFLRRFLNISLYIYTIGSGEHEMIQPSRNEKEKKEHILYSVDKINW